MVLAGPGMGDQPLPEWPLSRNQTKDERLLAAFCDYLDLDEQGYDELVREMWDLTLTKRFERLFAVLTTWFEYRLTLDESVLAWSMATVLTWPEGEGSSA